MITCITHKIILANDVLFGPVSISKVGSNLAGHECLYWHLKADEVHF